MTRDPRNWADHVAAWKASGESARAFSKGKGYTAGALYYWLRRLEQRPRPAAEAVRLARVVRPERPGRGSRRGQTQSENPPSLVLEVGDARILVGPGFDRDTLAELMDLLEQRRSQVAR